MNNFLLKLASTALEVAVEKIKSLQGKVTNLENENEKLHKECLFLKESLDMVRRDRNMLLRQNELKAMAKRPDFDEVHTLRNWYRGAVLRMKDGTDKDEFCKEAIEEVVHYLGGDEYLADLSIFNRNQLQKRQAQKQVR